MHKHVVHKAEIVLKIKLMKFKIIPFLLMFVASNLLSQEKKMNKIELKNLLIENARKGKFVENYFHPWKSDNTDNLYYESDTIKVYKYNTKSYKTIYCETVDWNFYNENDFVLKKLYLCEEPPLAEITKTSDSIQVSIIGKYSKLRIKFTNFGKKVEEFEVLGINENSEITEIKLRRIKK